MGSATAGFRRTHIPIVFATLLLAVFTGVTATAASAEAQRVSGVDRIVAFGDVHGDHQALVELLRFVDIIDAENRWSGGTTHLVSLGDLLDRGDDSRQAMDLLMALQAQALEAGGRVHVVLGNHELMNLTGDLRYVAPGEYAAFAANETPAMRAAGLAELTEFAARLPHDEEGTPAVTIDEAKYPPGFFAHREAFSLDGHYGRWLLELPSIVIVNNYAFVHAGFPSWLNDYSLEAINGQVRRDLTRLLAQGTQLRAEGLLPPFGDLLNPPELPEEQNDFRWLTQSPLLGERGPSWYRGTAHCHPLIEEPIVDSARGHFAVDTLVMGHSPTTTRRMQARFDGKAILADTGMASYYRGQPTAFIVEGDSISVAYPREEKREQVIAPPPSDIRLGLGPAELDEFMAQLEDVETPVVHAGFRWQPSFQPGNKRSISARVAAYRLDRLLGIGMVPPTVERKVNGRNGTLMLLPARTITETQRVEQQLFRPSPCDPIADYQLMYALDALTKNDERTGDSMLYDRANWSLTALASDRAFGNSTALPAYLERVSPELPLGLARRLEALDEDTLREALADYLSSRQLRAIDARRQTLLDSWHVGD